MNKKLKYLLVGALVLSAAGCAKKKTDEKNEEKPDDQAAQVTEDTETAEQPVDEVNEADAAMLADAAPKLAGEWTIDDSENPTSLVLAEDGFGRFQAMDKDPVDFQYNLIIDHMEDENGEDMARVLLDIAYNDPSIDSENVIVTFGENGEMTFTNPDGTPYEGLMAASQPWVKVRAED